MSAEQSTPQAHDFSGFTPLKSNFLYCPNQFFDICLRFSSRGVVRAVGYAIRQILGYTDENGEPIRDNVCISRRAFIERAGVSNGAIDDAMAAAITTHFLRCSQQPRRDVRNQSAQHAAYELCWDGGRPYTTSMDAFRGFFAGGGNFTPVPNQFFDEILPYEPLATLKVVGAVIRHTVGYENRTGGRKQAAALSRSYLARYTNLSIGRRLDAGIQSSLEKGYIEQIRKGSFDTRGREFGETSAYAMRWLRKTDSLTTAPKAPSKNSSENRSNRAIHSAPKAPSMNRSKKAIGRKTEGKTFSNNKQNLVAAEFAEAYEMLLKAGFDEATATTLAESRGLQVITNQIAWLPLRDVQQNPLGYLRRAIEHDFSKPTPANGREEGRTKCGGANGEAEAAALNQALDAASQKRELRAQRLAIWRAFSDEEKSNYFDRARSQNTSRAVRTLLRQQEFINPPSAVLALIDAQATQ